MGTGVSFSMFGRRLTQKESDEYNARQEALTKFKEEHARHIEAGAEQRRAYECSWHLERENKRVELAKLDALIYDRKSMLSKDSALLAEKDRTIAILQKAIENITRD